VPTSLLTTRLYTPRVTPQLVPRPRLIEQLQAGLHRKLTLISAPAGFGKTTLVAEWVQETDRPCAWLSLDEGDNDPARFFSYLVAALQSIDPDIGKTAQEVLQAAEPPPPGSVLTSLINDIAATRQPFIFVLDDYHVIDVQWIQDALAFLLEHLPPQMHLVIATRADPPLSLSRLRGRGHMTELRTVDLRFTPEEAAAFLNQAMGLGLSEEDVAVLEGRTEGWIVGLQMAALSMQGRKDIASFIQAFTGSNRYILDYLTDEVLLQQPENVRTFLLQTAILDRLTGSLCDAVTERNDSRGMLKRLESANLFIVPLDDERRWYRYHQLFASLLRQRLGQTWPELRPELHRRASEWYEEHEVRAEALRHALQARDGRRAARLVGGAGLATLQHAELRVLERWLDTLVDEDVQSEPWLCIARAWVSAFTARLDAVEPLLGKVEHAAAGHDPTSTGRTLSESEWQHLRGHIATVRACVATLEGDSVRTAELAHDALELLPTSDAMTRAWVAMILGLNFYQRGDVDAADQALSEALTISRATRDSHVTVVILGNIAAIQIGRGQLRRAEDSLRDALQVADAYAERAGSELPVSAYAHVSLGSLLLQWNDLQAAWDHLQEGVRLSRRWGEPLRLSGAYLQLANLLQARGDAQGALGAIHRAKQSAGRFSPWLTARVAMVEALICLRQGDTATAFRWADSHSDAAPHYFGPDELWQATLVRAHIELARGRLDQALDLLKQVEQEAQGAAGKDALIGTLVLQAIALQAKPDQALAALERALSLAEPEGYVRTFIDAGAPMSRLLREAVAQGIAPRYARSLLAALDAERKGGQQPTELPRSATRLRSPSVEPLTERERQVLRLLTTRLSSTEIAEQLVLSPNTVRSHIKSIYSKLDVHSRQGALDRATGLGLL